MATVLRLTRTFAAPRERVFRAWTEPAALARWWIPQPGYTLPRAEIDLRVGGRYRLTMRDPAGHEFALVGAYREVHAPERLVYTWCWEETASDAAETLVTVEFHARATTTEVVLTHERFSDAAACARHREGWSGCLEHLEEVLT